MIDCLIKWLSDILLMPSKNVVCLMCVYDCQIVEDTSATPIAPIHHWSEAIKNGLISGDSPLNHVIRSSLPMLTCFNGCYKERKISKVGMSLCKEVMEFVPIHLLRLLEVSKIFTIFNIKYNHITSHDDITYL